MGIAERNRKIVAHHEGIPVEKTENTRLLVGGERQENPALFRGGGRRFQFRSGAGAEFQKGGIGGGGGDDPEKVPSSHVSIHGEPPGQSF